MKNNSYLRIAIYCLVLPAMIALAANTLIAQGESVNKAAGKTKNVVVDKTKDVAKSVSSDDSAQDDEDEKLDDAFRKFGQAAGAAYQCVPDTEKEKTGSDIRRAFNRIGQLFGTDRAFYFAVHFGRSVNEPFDKSKCAELTTKLRESAFLKRVMN